MSKTVFDGQRAGENRVRLFDFTALLALGETISAQEVVCTVYTGDDDSPEDVISGAATESNGVVSQNVFTSVAGNVYNLVCSVETSAGQVLQIAGLVAVLPDQA